MKTPSIDLYELINSLTKHEKRFVLLDLKDSRQQINYLLFASILQLKRYNEDDLKLALQEPKIVSTLPFHKNKLYNTILKILRKYRLTSNEKLNISQQIDFLAILKEKRLFKKLKKEINRLQKICIKREYYPFLLQISLFKKQLIIETETKNVIEKLKQISGNEKQYLKRIETQTNLESIDRMLFFNNKININRKEIAEQIIKEKKFNKIKPISFKEIYQYQCIQSQIAWAKQDMKAYLKWRKESYTLWTKNISKRKKKLFTYTSVLINYLDACRITKNKTEFFNTLEKINSITTKQKDVISRIFFFSNNMQLMWYVSEKKFFEGIKLFKKINIHFYKRKISKTNKISMLNNYCICLMQTRRYKQAQNTINDIKKLKAGDVRKDIAILIAIYIVLIDVSQNNLYDEKRKKHLLLFKNMKVPELSEMIKLLFEFQFSEKQKHKKNIKAQLMIFAKNHKNIFGYFDFTLWIKNCL